MKRPISLLLASSAMVLSVGMAACGGAPTTDDTAAPEETEEAAPEEGAEEGAEESAE